MKRLFSLFLVLCIALSLAVPAFAAEEEADLEYIGTQKDVVFWVSWDVEMPGIMFIAPDGTEYDPMVEQEGTTTIVGEKDLYYVVLNAQAGQWRIRYDKKGNTTLEVTVHDYNSGLSIDTYTVGEVSNNRVRVDFLVYGPENVYYNYRISAMIDYTGAEMELASGSARTGRDVSKTVYLDNLSSYNGYMLKLYVWYDDDGTDVFDFAYSDPFEYINSDVDSRAEDFAVTITPDEQLLEVSWDDLSWRIDSVMVAIFEDGGAEPTVFDSYDPDEVDSVQFSYDPAATEVAVEFTVCYNGVNAAPVRKTIKLSDFVFTAPEGDAFNTVVWPVAYVGLSNQAVSMTVNDVKTDLVLDGDGTLSVTLNDEWNEICISYTTAENITWQVDRKVYVDRFAPILTMTQDYDGMHVAGSVATVSGKVINCDLLTINGKEVKVGEDGTFSCELTLQKGENPVTVVAQDALGNAAQYAACIYSGSDAGTDVDIGEALQTPGGLLEVITGGYWVLLVTSVLGVLVIVYALVFWRKGGKK